MSGDDTLPVRHAAWMMDRSDEAALVTDLAGVIRYVNPAFERLTGYATEEAIGRSVSILKSGRHSRDFYKDLWCTLRAGREFHGVLINRRKDGETYHEEKTIRPLFDRDGQITHFLSCGRDVSDRVAAVEKLAHAALHDDLTELPNRALFLDRLHQAISRARRSGEPFAVALADLDSFKSINDSLGHQTGDTVLRAAAVRLRLSVREVDTVARLGGDEFGILLPGVADAVAAAHVLRKFVEAFAASPIRLGDASTIALTISVGASVCPIDGEDEAALMGAADRAMYRAKNGHGPPFRVNGDRDPAPGDGLPNLAQAATLEAEEALRLLAREVAIQRRVIHAGETLFRAGDCFRNVYVLRCGACKLISLAPDGREQLVALLFKGDWLGLEGIAGGTYACDAVALDTGELWAMRYDALVQAGARSPDTLGLLHAAMSREIVRERDATATHLALPADAKVAYFLQQLAERLAHSGLRSDPITLRVTRAEIGSYLGLTLESVSRAISRLAKEDVIQFGQSGRREVHIRKLAALHDFVRRYAS
jgi:CRP/FNR family transcriptional regulator, anaerobic regulatory protein